MRRQLCSAPTPPVVIGGIGYSGTRVVMRIARDAGYFMGRNLNDTEDSLDFYDVAERWSAWCHARWVAGEPVSAPMRLRRQLAQSIRRHRAPLGGDAARWGWKQPRSIHFLPLLEAGVVGLRYIHVIRDGRDLVVGDHAAHRFSHGLRGTGVYSAAAALRFEPLAPPAVRMMAFWAQVNQIAADFGDAYMGENFMTVRLEELCERPESTVRTLFRFLGSAEPDPAAVERGIEGVHRPASLGSFRHVEDEQLRDAVESAGAAALSRFGYATRGSS